MSRSTTKFIMAITITAFIALAGCAQKETLDARAIPGGKDFTPERIVERVFTAIQTGELTGIDAYFSAEITPGLVEEFVKNINSSMKIDKYKALPVSSDAKNAEVKILYRFIPKVDGAFARRTKKQVSEKIFKLVKEDDIWRVRKTGFKDFDQKVESRIFMSCLESVMDAAIAEEKTRQMRGEYAASVAALLKVMPDLNEMTCEELNIEMTGESSYLITAKTLNSDPCLIVANTDSYAPKSYLECPSFNMDSIPQTGKNKDTGSEG